MKDLISKADVLETYAELYDTFEDNQFIRKELNKVYDKLNGLPYAQPEPCEDAVSREAVSSWLKQYGQDVLHGKYKFSLMYIWKNLMDLPSAQPETDCAFKEFGNCSYSETGCSDCKVKAKIRNALSVQPEPYGDVVSRADVFDMLDMYPFTEYGEYETAREIVKRLPSVEPKPDQYEDALKKIKNASFVGSDGLDYVETLQALDALKDAIGVTLHVEKISKHCSDFSDLYEVIECEDAVSREAVYEAMVEKGQRSRRYRLGETWELNGTEIREALDTVSSVEPKRKTGKWIRHPEWQADGECGYECYQCGMGSDVDYDFCMKCGAKMDGRE